MIWGRARIAPKKHIGLYKKIGKLTITVGQYPPSIAIPNANTPNQP